MVEHLVALVEDEARDAAETQLLVSYESVETSRSRNDDVGVSLLVLEECFILLDVDSTVEDGSLHLWHVLAEPSILVLDLEGQLTCMTHDDDTDFAVDGLDLLQSGQDEDGCLSETGFSLAENIGSENGLWNADLLDWRKMLELVCPIVLKCAKSRRASVPSSV